MKDTSIARR